jgi:TPR repeat protein
MGMRAGGVADDKADLIRWWDALPALVRGAFAKGLRLARESQHPDAKWMSSLFPSDNVSREELIRVMEAQGDDPRALYLRDMRLGVENGVLLRRAAEMGFAPAQYELGTQRTRRRYIEEGTVWLDKAAVQGYRAALFSKGCTIFRQEGLERALPLLREAAELHDPNAEFEYGMRAFGESDPERYVWYCRAAEHGYPVSSLVWSLCKLFASSVGEDLGQIVFVVGPVLKQHLDVSKQTIFDEKVCIDEAEKLQHVAEWYKKRRDAAKRAIESWSIVGRRLNVAKDMRVKIARLAWEQRWMWGERAKRDSAGEERSNIGRAKVTMGQ